MRGTLPWLTFALLAVACGPAPERETQPGNTSKAAAPGPRAARQLSEAERTAMLSALGSDQTGPHTIWFAVTTGDAEAVAFKNALEAVFKQAGWTIETQPVTGMMLKPGLSIL